MIDVDERGAPRQAGRGRKSNRLRDVLNRAVALLMIQTVGGTADDEQIGTAVVVVVAGHRRDRRGAFDAHVGSPAGIESAPLLPADQHGLSRHEDEIELAVGVHVGEGHAGCE